MHQEVPLAKTPRETVPEGEKRFDNRRTDATSAAECKKESETREQAVQARCEKLEEVLLNMEASKRRYKDHYARHAAIFNDAPVGYVIIDAGGIIQEVNQTASDLLDVESIAMLGSPMADFIHPEDIASFHFIRMQCRESHGRFSTELRLIGKAGHFFHARLYGQARRHPQADPHLLMTIIDMDDQVRERRTGELIHHTLRLGHRHATIKAFLNELIAVIKQFAGCEAVGIRLRHEDGMIPYQAYDGFSQAFFERENALSLNIDSCMCIYVIRGETNPDEPFFTARGSFFTNASSRLLASMPKEKLGKTRNVCNEAGYESVALIPITMPGKIMGLIHLADRRENKLPLELMEALETMAPHLGAVLHRFTIGEELKEALHDLNDISKRLLKTREEEQRRIGMELHDQMGQNLGALKIGLSGILGRLDNGREDLKARGESLLALTDRIIEDVRDMARKLRPTVLETLGLDAALKSLIRELERNAECSVISKMTPLAKCFDADSQATVYRIVQEAFTNIVKHAGATTVRLRIRVNHGWVSIQIRDNGRGFKIGDHLFNGTRLKGLGLGGMRLRAEMARGAFKIFSKQGEGTTIEIALPVMESEADDD